MPSLSLLNALLKDEMILTEITKGITFDPNVWGKEKKILIWEAFVSGGKNSPKDQHLKDAEVAVEGFMECYKSVIKAVSPAP